MSDIELYDKSPEAYEDLQLRRPDYTPSIQMFRKLAKEYLPKTGIIIADFCCGTGKNTALVAQDTKVEKAVLVDINKDFIEIAKAKSINTTIFPLVSDILTAPLTCECDAVISMFAYHHVKDSDKIRYIDQVKSALKKDGLLFLGEIYTTDKETTLKYYKKLLNEIGSNSRLEELNKFLMETAKSDNCEFKVNQEFAHNQLKENGFELLRSEKIWPKDEELGNTVGMFVEVWKLFN
jgi:ubiquinone/menaquinone biosynthesis C-methylase UbiE